MTQRHDEPERRRQARVQSELFARDSAFQRGQYDFEPADFEQVREKVAAAQTLAATAERTRAALRALAADLSDMEFEEEDDRVRDMLQALRQRVAEIAEP